MPGLGLHMTVKPMLGGATESCFPQTEQWFHEDSEHEEAIRFLCRRVSWTLKYDSLLDLLFVGVFPEERSDCLRYYRGCGPKLVELKSEEQIRLGDKMLLHAAKEAHTLYKLGRKRFWKTFLDNIDWKPLAFDPDMLAAVDRELEVLRERRQAQCG